jgi:hypothetical protein
VTVSRSYDYSSSRVAEDERGNKDQRPLTDDLQCREPPTCAKEPVANTGNQDQFDGDHHISHQQSQMQLWYEEGQRISFSWRSV